MNPWAILCHALTGILAVSQKGDLLASSSDRLAPLLIISVRTVAEIPTASLRLSGAPEGRAVEGPRGTFGDVLTAT